jgi:hypothetical protein
MHVCKSSIIIKNWLYGFSGVAARIDPTRPFGKFRVLVYLKILNLSEKFKILLTKCLFQPTLFTIFAGKNNILHIVYSAVPIDAYRYCCVTLPNRSLTTNYPPISPIFITSQRCVVFVCLSQLQSLLLAQGASAVVRAGYFNSSSFRRIMHEE